MKAYNRKVVLFILSPQFRIWVACGNVLIEKMHKEKEEGLPTQTFKDKQSQMLT